MRRVWSSALLACVAAGCSSASSPSDVQSPPILTDQPVYTVRQGETLLPDGSLYGRFIEFSMILRYTNPTPGPIYLPTCHGVHPPVIEKKEHGQWVVAFAPIVLACLGPPEIIRPGGTYEYTYRVQAHLPGSRVMPQFQTEVPGTYRLVWSAYRTWTPNSSEPGLGEELPRDAGLSNEFELLE